MSGIKATLGTIVALILLPVGLAFVMTPIPLGLPIFVVAVFLLLVSNRKAVGMIITGRRRVPLLDRWLEWVERAGGNRFGRILRKTRPKRVPKRK